MMKQARQYAIKQIISARPIASQEDLRRALRKEGFRVTQATLSRDMKLLGINRVATGDTVRYELRPASEPGILAPVVNVEVLAIDANEGVIVVRTLPGCANTVAEFIDGKRNPEIIGTVAGDNTLLVIPRSQRLTKSVVQFLSHTLIEGA